MFCFYVLFLCFVSTLFTFIVGHVGSNPCNLLCKFEWTEKSEQKHYDQCIVFLHKHVSLLSKCVLEYLLILRATFLVLCLLIAAFVAPFLTFSLQRYSLNPYEIL
jgi:hypothetical protein